MFAPYNHTNKAVSINHILIDQLFPICRLLVVGRVKASLVSFPNLSTDHLHEPHWCVHERETKAEYEHDHEDDDDDQ